MKNNPIRDRKIRIALLGCGRISSRHFEAIEQLSDDIELVGVCDQDAEALEKTMQARNVPGFLSLTDLLANTDADLVSVCTPSGLHPVQTIDIARAGRHVITEKPMATRWEEGVAMVRACQDAGVRLFVVKQNRHNATIQSLKKAIDAGRFGNIYMVNVNVFWTRPQAYYDQATWRGTWGLDGGALMNQASHYIDLLHWLLGPVAAVQAMTGTLARDIEAEDTAVLNVRWATGTLGSVNVTMLTYPKNFEGSIAVLGEKGTVRLGGIALNAIEHWEFDTPHPNDQAIRDAASYETDSVYGAGHTLYYKNVVAVLRGCAEPATDGHEGLKSLELLVSAYRSAAQGSVAVPLHAETQ